MALPNTSTTRLGSPGDIVVPFSDIAALLQSRLSDLELNNLLSQLVGTRTTLVQPGDLITAEWATDVLTRLVRLEGGGIGDVGSPLGQRAVRTLLQTYESYGTLVSRRSFMPDGTTPDALTAALNLTVTLQNVLIIAAASTGPAEASTADGLVEIFKRLYTAQKDLATLMTTNIPGVSDPQPRLLFAQRLNDLLDNNDGTTGALSLNNAITQRQPEAAVSAQDRINGIVTTTAGDRIVGNVEVRYRDSTRGETLAIGDAASFGYIFRVTNKTNRDLTLNMDAGFLAPRESWSTSVSAVGGLGQPLVLRAFNASNPLDPASTRDIQINVATPPGSAVGNTGMLRFRVTAPSPVNVIGADFVTLRVDNAATPPQPARVRFIGPAPLVENGSLNPAPVDEPVDLKFDLQFTTTIGATSRDFRLRIDSTNPAADVNRFFIGFADAAIPIDAANSTATRKQSMPFPLNDAQQRSLHMQIVPQAGAGGTTLNLTATIEAVADSTITESRQFTIRAV